MAHARIFVAAILFVILARSNALPVSNAGHNSAAVANGKQTNNMMPGTRNFVQGQYMLPQLRPQPRFRRSPDQYTWMNSYKPEAQVPYGYGYNRGYGNQMVNQLVNAITAQEQLLMSQRGMRTHKRSVSMVDY